MLDKAFAERIIHDYKVRTLSRIVPLKNTLIFNCCSDCCQPFMLIQDIFKQATEDRLTSANELPYFEGDFWPNVLEESIKELEQEEEERKKEENTASTETTEVSQ